MIPTLVLIAEGRRGRLSGALSPGPASALPRPTTQLGRPPRRCAHPAWLPGAAAKDTPDLYRGNPGFDC